MARRNRMKKSKKAKTVKTATKTMKKTKTTKKVVYPIVKPSIIEDLSVYTEPEVNIVDDGRVPFEVCDEMWSLLSYAFHPNGFEDENGEIHIDDRFTALWKTFLLFAGYTEEEYWEIVDSMPHEKCEKCQKEDEERVAKEKEDAAKNAN